jgi:hypothetical protein
MAAYTAAWKWETNRAFAWSTTTISWPFSRDQSIWLKATASSGPGAISAKPSGMTLLGGRSLTTSNMCSIVRRSAIRV